MDNNPKIVVSPVPPRLCQNCSQNIAEIRAESVGSRLDICWACAKANSGRFGWPVYEDARAASNDWTRGNVSCDCFAISGGTAMHDPACEFAAMREP